MSINRHKVLIAYFSHSGNTRIVAETIQKLTGGDLFAIETVTPYPQDYNTVVEIAKREQTANERPALTAQVADMASYDTLILGYPNWWSTIPMPVFTFLEGYNFSGKVILPYCTHEGSAMGHSERDIARLCPGAEVKSGLPIRGSSVHAAQAAVSDWLKRSGVLE